MRSKIKLYIVAITAIVIISLYIYIESAPTVVYQDYTSTILYNDKTPHEERLDKYTASDKNNIPYEFQYRNGNIANLREWLINENSILANEPYFSSIICSAQTYNINPCLLFAITGREQSFVPKTHPRVYEISNNPFNVFGSWQVYNTDISDSANIACETILKISKDRPPGIEFLKWLNTKNGIGGYAEDPLWNTGVNKFFKIMNNEIY